MNPLLMGNISVMLPAEIYKMRSHLSLAKPRQKTKAILEAYELFIYGDIWSVINSFRANVLSIGTP